MLMCLIWNAVAAAFLYAPLPAGFSLRPVTPPRDSQRSRTNHVTGLFMGAQPSCRPGHGTPATIAGRLPVDVLCRKLLQETTSPLPRRAVILDTVEKIRAHSSTMISQVFCPTLFFRIPLVRHMHVYTPLHPD